MSNNDNSDLLRGATSHRDATMLDHEEWRLGHRRPWWQWNVITLFVLLFALIWARELLDWNGGWTWFVCILVLLMWLAVPACIGFQRGFMQAHRRRVHTSTGAGTPVQDTPATKRRALIIISIAAVWIALQLLALIR